MHRSLRLGPGVGDAPLSLGTKLGLTCLLQLTSENSMTLEPLDTGWFTRFYPRRFLTVPYRCNTLETPRQHYQSSWLKA